MAWFQCKHFETMTEPADPISDVCDSCVEMGDTWVHLRACLHCGVVGCCDNSKNRHARHHSTDNDHPLVKSIEPGETWKYCFPDRTLLKT